MAGQNDAVTGGSSTTGWLLTRADGVIVACDEAAAALVRAPSSEPLIGRSWLSLVTSADRRTAEDARGLVAEGAGWTGRLRFVYDLDAVALDVGLSPATGDDERMVVIRLATVEATAGAPRPTAGDDSHALVVALDAEGALHDDAAAAYAVLQALRQAVRFDWAAVLRFEGAEAAQVTGTFPTPMAGVGPGLVWSPLDGDEASVVTGREPRLDVELGRSPGSPSPLARLPAFGLTSRLLIPLFEGPAVVGAVACYAQPGAAFAPIDGLRVERFVRRLGQRLGQRLARLDGASADAAGGGAPAGPAPGSGGALLDEVVAEVAHQLNNPLTSILGYAQLLPSLPDEERAAALATIEQEAERAARLVRNLLAFGREQPEPTSSAPPQSPAPPAAASARVLLASPDAPLLTLASEVLAGGGYAVDAAATAEAAMGFARGRSYVAAVVDGALESGGRPLFVVLETEVPALAARIIVATEDPARAFGRPAIARGRLAASLLEAVAELGRR